MSVVFNSQAPPVLDDGTRARVADLRARGRSWDAVAAEINWDVTELLAACRADERYRAALELAQEELADEAMGEALHKLRALLRDEDPKTAREATKIIAVTSSKKWNHFLRWLR